MLVLLSCCCCVVQLTDYNENNLPYSKKRWNIAVLLLCYVGSTHPFTAKNDDDNRIHHPLYDNLLRGLDHFQQKNGKIITALHTQNATIY
jgi:hypothetical protein